MNRSRRLSPLFLLLLVLVVSSCKGPQEAFTKSSRSLHDAIAPAHIAYLEADATLDAEQKARRIRTVKAWGVLIKKAEGQ